MTNKGLLLLNKEKGYSSRDYIAKVAKKLGIKKFGHIGTLDPFATGLIIAAFNQGTKIVPFFEGLDKTYIAKLKLGEKTSTGDLDGEVTETKVVGELSKEKILEVFASLTGKITQTPPIYSAIKVNGKPLYHYARHGLEVEIKSREVTIYHIKLLSCKDNVIEFEAKVSNGTYIRTLGEDIASKLNTVGHLISLVRTEQGAFTLDQATNYDDVTLESITSLEDAISSIMEIKEIEEGLLKKVDNGNPINLDSESPFVALKYQNDIISIYQKKDGNLYNCYRGLR